MSAVLQTNVTPIDALLRDARVWRGQEAPAPARSPHPSGFDALDEALPTGGWPEAALVEIWSRRESSRVRSSTRRSRSCWRATSSLTSRMTERMVRSTTCLVKRSCDLNSR